METKQNYITSQTPYDSTMDLNNTTCTDKSLNVTYVYEASKDVNIIANIDSSILNEDDQTKDKEETLVKD
jgi:hypothetical protein